MNAQHPSTSLLEGLNDKQLEAVTLPHQSALILAGAGLSFGYVWRRPVLVGLVSLFKILIMPILAWSICYALGGDRMAQGIALACGAAPCAAAAYVQARHMGGDATLMAGIVALTTTLSAITMPLLLWLFHLV